MQFIRVAKKSDFQHTRFRVYSILARKLAIFKEAGGAFYAIEYMCKHQNWDLSTAPLKGNCVTCPRHGWIYDVRTGKCLNHDSTPLRRFGLKVEGEDILVSLFPVDEHRGDTDQF